MRKIGLGFILFFMSIAPAGAVDSFISLPGHEMSLWWILPFVGTLLSLAVLPLLAPKLWHHHYGKITLLWSLGAIIPLILIYGFDTALYEVLHTYLLEYIPFILVAMTLFTISGGIKMKLAMAGTPGANTMFLTVATFVASWIGTTGAAMLFIRPILVMNAWRHHKSHLILFFILTVCNLGGSLTALGDPPLFLGFLKGIPFFWPFTHLMLPFLIVVIPVLILFFFLDRHYYYRENLAKKPTKSKLENRINGKINLILLLCVMVSVIISGNWKPGISFEVYHIQLELQNIVRDVSFIVLTILSIILTPKKVRKYNLFSWDPMKEVAKLFAGIFVTAMPVITILGAGEKGALSSIVSLVNWNGQPVNDMYFWLTGLLSAFLDNAPTYLVFFYMAGGDAELLSTTLSATLTAISAGAVFMGALTYIGNAPNFLVKSIAESNDISMPSFFGYTLRAGAILLPLFAFLSWVMF